MHELKNMETRVEKLETSEMQTEDTASDGKWSDRINIGGVIEAEAAYESMEDDNVSYIALATVELGIDADINEHVSGHALLLWEEDDTEPIDIDQGFISFYGGDEISYYLDVGKMYVSFGSFESHFISDLLTLEIGETRESAVKTGYVNDMFDISFSFFNGNIDEVTGDDKIGTFTGSAVSTLPENTAPDFNFALGVSYISNIADSDGLEGEVLFNMLNDHVGGIGLFLNVSLLERFFIEMEYVGATGKFEANELSFDNGMEYEPKAFNREFTWTPNENLELGLKYEVSDDLGDFLPEKQLC